MFRVRTAESDRFLRAAVIAVLALSASALAVTVWVMVDFLAEQRIVHELIRELPADLKSKAEALEGELRWQFRLSILILLNFVVTGSAVVLLSRAYRSTRASLRDIKALAGDILSSVEQAVITTDLDGNVTSINRRGLEILAPAADVVDQPLADVSQSLPLEELRQSWADSNTSELTQDLITSLDGSERVLRAFCQPLRDIDNSEIGCVIQLHDVTDQLLIEDHMRRLQRYMGLGSMAAGLHHEIKNPLAALSLHVQLLQEVLERLEPSDEALQMLGVIMSEVKRIGGVLEGFRDFASTETLNLAPLDLRHLIQRQIDLMLPQATKQSVAIVSEISQDVPKAVAADQIRLEQVLLNVLVNAVEAMPDGGEVVVSAHAEPELVVIEVRDTGGGVPEELRDKIFDPYFSTKSDGTGLGLALSDKIMRQHDGGLDLRTSPRGATFRLTLPASTTLSEETE